MESWSILTMLLLVIVHVVIPGHNKQKHTVDYLLNSHFPRRISSDIDADPCKSDEFYGDIALPNIRYEIEYDLQKLNKTYQEELKKYEKEIMLEGLQIEEEGLLELHNYKKKNDERISKEKHRTRHEKHEKVHETQEELNETGKEFVIKTERDEGRYKKLKTDENRKMFELDEEFEQVEPKYFPNYEMKEEKKEAIVDETSKQRIHNERQRRIQHTGDPATLETMELEKMLNGTQTIKDLRPEIQSGKGVQVERNPYRADMIKDGSFGRNVKDKSRDMINLEKRLTEINEQELKRQERRRGRKKQNINRRRNDKRMNIETTSETTEQKPRIRHTGTRKNRRRNKKQGRHPNKKERQSIRSHRSTTPIPFLLDAVHRRVTRAATARKERVWDYGVIPYEIDGNFSGGHKALFKQAMRHWENFTCVKFVERIPSEHPNYIIFTERPCGCCSFVGKRGNGPQAISIGKNCDKFGIVVHELGHVVGFWHEHTRPDRDNHVQIVRENIMGGQEYNFNKLNDDEVNSLGLPYDYESIMHYARNTFSKGTYLDTIHPLEKAGVKKRPEIGQRIKLSEGDIAQTNLVYKCHKCGKTMQENSGRFSSPDHTNVSSNYPGEKCEWRITATHGEKIVLTFQDLDIHETEDCKTDYVEVRDGYWHRSEKLAKFCHTGVPAEPITSTGSRMLVTYVTSNKASSHRGFTASYEALCGGELLLDEEVGHLESPNYPDDYHANKECIWKLKVPEDFQIALKFQSFEVENHDNCVYDYVEVRDGHDDKSPILGTFCGYKLPPNIRSTGNLLMVKFLSDGSVQKGGFSATFMKEYDECSLLDHGCEHDCVNTLGGFECTCRIGYELHSDSKHCEDACGGMLNSSNGTITSPSFPETYPTNKKCTWEIVAPPQYKITLNFTHFDLEGNNIYHQECEYDKVEVSTKFNDDSLKRHGVFCGSRKPAMITSENNRLRVEFNSDNTVQKSGFAAVFFTDMDECATDNGGCQHECQNTIGSYTCSCHNGFTLHENGHDCKEGGCKHEVTAPYGEIESPNYPDYYPSKKDCVWHFTTTPGHRIKLVFSEFETEPHQECAYDHVVMYDGNSPDDHTLGRFCGSKLPHPIIATGNQMYMVFKSDASVQRKGFRATHSTVCGGHLQATSHVKHLYSHAKYGDFNYENRADCDWSIEAAPGRNVLLTFLTFEIEDESDCGYDFVEVYSGLDASGPSYGRFCGSSNPTDLISGNEALVVRFRSDDSISGKGFSAAYVATDPLDSDEFEEKIFKMQDNDQ